MMLMIRKNKNEPQITQIILKYRTSIVVSIIMYVPIFFVFNNYLNITLAYKK